ncbi:hypothetical protein [Streptomyces sp. HM190]|uniref:hypothetical protein n=1 Tax=Streptomyces sp. HM190 TaxID=2695266 RepID=UPI00135929D0|nr:hypothetical protein [Streptomyces sp. HM190]
MRGRAHRPEPHAVAATPVSAPGRRKVITVEPATRPGDHTPILERHEFDRLSRKDTAVPRGH